MKKIKFLAFTFVVFLSFMLNIYALCSASEENRIRSLAVNVRASYEIVDEVMEPGTYSPPDGVSEDEYEAYTSVMKIYIYNITEDLYVEVRNSLTGETKKYTYADSLDGTVVLSRDDFGSIVTYQISVYSNITDCLSGVKIRTLELKTPKYNDLSRYGFCSGLEEFYLCYKFIDYDIDLTFVEAENRIDAYRLSKDKKQQEENDNKVKSFGEFLSENKGPVIAVTLAIIGLGGGATIVVLKKRGRIG